MAIVLPQAAAGLAPRSIPGSEASVSTIGSHARALDAWLATATSLERDQLDAIARASSGLRSWLDDAGRPIPLAHDVLTMIVNAGADGLDPDDYDPVALTVQSLWLNANGAATDADRTTFDTAMNLALLRYLHDVHEGRIDPASVGALISARQESVDWPEIVLSLRRLGAPAAVRDALAPRFPQYARLREALDRYRALAARMPAVPAITLDRTIHRGDAMVSAQTLRAELLAYDDLPDDAARSTSTTYDDALMAGVRHFQRRHGLADDGVLGPRTREELAVPVATRVRQIELAMERLRWLPPLPEDRTIAVNIPMFRLWASDAPGPDARPFETSVIVGRALGRETPVLLEEMTSIIFRPYWNVPTTILRHELLPIVRRDPAYLDREGFEIVRGDGDDAPVIEPTAAAIASLGVTTRLRQRPGPKNSLGLVKFVFPNSEDVYLHGTPSADLFMRDRRDLSHGCVRVKDHIGLAVWALDDPAWDRERVAEAMNAGRDNRRLTLTRRVRVVLFYTTAVVSPDDGTLLFAHDWYGHDRLLDQKLRRSSATKSVQ